MVTEGARVLLVDDERANIATFRRVFRPHLAMVFASSGEEALALLARDAGVGLVLSDFTMPEMNGLALMRRVRDAFPHVRRALLTAYGDTPAFAEALSTGLCDAILEKPWTRDSLLARIRPLLMPRTASAASP